MNSTYFVGDLPFYYAPLSSCSNIDLPDTLSFTLSIQPETGLVIQAYNRQTEAILDQAYRKGSIVSGIMDDSGIGKQYADDFIGYILQALERSRLDGLHVLDIGCGLGYLVHRLGLLGAETIGVDPGADCLGSKKRFDANIICDYFPTPEIRKNFDLITAFCVIEHIWEHGLFINNMRRQLKPGGTIIMAVPDCSPYMQVGDISFLFHEHWSYFTHTTLKETILFYAPDAEVFISKGTFGGTLYAMIKFNENSRSRGKIEVENLQFEFFAFRDRIDEMFKKLQSFLKQALSREKTLGIFAPIRAINFLSALRDCIPLERVRFYDDDAKLHGKYFPGFEIPVRSRAELISAPPDSLLITSMTFGDNIKQELLSINVSCDVFTLKQIIET